MLSYVVHRITNIKVDEINLGIIILIHVILIISLFKVKKLKYGIGFFRDDVKRGEMHYEL